MMRKKPTMTKAELKQRINEEAKIMKEYIKRQGGNLTLAECKREAKRVFEEEYDIV